VTTPAREHVWSASPIDVDAPEVVAMLRSYMSGIVGRFHGRPATAAEVDAAITEEPSDTLAPPRGVFLLARYAGRPAGCVGIRLLTSTVAELKRMFVCPDLRGNGGGSYLLDLAEEHALRLGASRMRLDTRGDLTEARSLYAARGYQEIPAYNTNPYAEHWFEKELA
jgi:GNAT superfamily N-acetyltransferase